MKLCIWVRDSSPSCWVYMNDKGRHRLVRERESARKKQARARESIKLKGRNDLRTCLSRGSLGGVIGISSRCVQAIPEQPALPKKNNIFVVALKKLVVALMPPLEKPLDVWNLSFSIFLLIPLFFAIPINNITIITHLNLRDSTVLHIKPNWVKT